MAIMFTGITASQSSIITDVKTFIVYVTISVFYFLKIMYHEKKGDFYAHSIYENARFREQLHLH